MEAAKKGGASAIEMRAVEGLIPNARNSRVHSDKQVAQIAASIKAFGFNAPVLIMADGTIIAGHGRVLAARKLKMAEVPCVVLEHLSESDARAYIIADNKLTEAGAWDNDVLQMELAELKDCGFNLADFGFSDSELKTLLEGVVPSGDGSKEAPMGELQYKVIIDCINEEEQADLLARFEQEGLKCRALML